MGEDEHPRCPTSGKVMFPSRNEAARIAKLMTARDRRLKSIQSGAKLEVYVCKVCHRYHIGRSILGSRDRKEPYGKADRCWKPMDDD